MSAVIDKMQPTKVIAGTPEAAARARELFPGVPVEIDPAAGRDGWRIIANVVPTIEWLAPMPGLKSAAAEIAGRGAIAERAPRMEALLRRLEWSGLYNDGTPCCFVCRAPQDRRSGPRHDRGCELGDLLAELDAAKNERL